MLRGGSDCEGLSGWRGCCTERGRAVLLECGGRLVFCEGVGPAEGFQVTGRTRRALEVEIRPRELSEERNHTGTGKESI